MKFLIAIPIYNIEDYFYTVKSFSYKKEGTGCDDTKKDIKEIE